MLTVTNLTKQFGGFTALNGVSLTSEGGVAPLPTVVARLAARSSLPPLRSGLRRQGRRSKRER
jgi:hypothetical protein